MFGVWRKHNGPLANLTGKCHQAGARSVDRGTKAIEKTGTQQTQNPRELLPHTVPKTSLEMFPGKHQHNFSTAYSKIKKIILKKTKTSSLCFQKCTTDTCKSKKSETELAAGVLKKITTHKRSRLSQFIFLIICLWVTCLLLGKGSIWTICACMFHNMADHLHHWQKVQAFHTSVAKQKT